MPFCVKPDHTTIGLGLFIDLVEIMQFSKSLQFLVSPWIERYALAFLRGMISPARIEPPEHPAVIV